MSTASGTPTLAHKKRRVRWVAALQLGIGKIPANVVNIPESEAEEIEDRRWRSQILDYYFGPNEAHYRPWPHPSLVGIARLLNRRETVGQLRTFLPSGEFLEELVRGRKSKRHLERARSPYAKWLVSSGVDWWLEVLEEVKKRGPAPQHIYEEMDQVYTHVAGAIREEHLDYGRTNPLAGLELLKCYRVFTRSICALARERWPAENLQKLWDQS